MLVLSANGSMGSCGRRFLSGSIQARGEFRMVESGGVLLKEGVLHFLVAFALQIVSPVSSFGVPLSHKENHIGFSLCAVGFWLYGAFNPPTNTSPH